jgi:hypothetical protein
MPEFNDTQQELDQARQARVAARRERFVADEKLRNLARQRDELKRRRTDAAEAELAELEQTAKQLGATVERLRAREQSAAAELAERFKAFEQYSDPVDNASRLQDRYPILLFPLRIETRFKQVRDDEPQLWVRVYPDDIAVDTFEEVLSEVEISNARIYWTNVWKAGGNDGEKRAAWQSLVKSHGAGRAFWIIEQVAPLNPGDEPVKGLGEHLLIVVTDTPLPVAEKPPVQAYWRRVFLAQNSQAELDAARTDLVAALGAARADEIAANYAPQNLTAPVAAAGPPTAIRVEFLELPDAATIDTQQLPWMNAANTAVLPERFVVLGFNGDTQTLIQIGRPVPPELVIGPNPMAPPEQQLRLEEGELVVPDELKWLTDFETAVDQGMGFRIDLTPTQARRGFDRLFVLGLRLGADVAASTQDLEKLIRNHQRSRKGFSLLPQGAPTNNVEDDESGYSWRADADLSYDHYFGQDPADDPQDWRRKKDGRWLAESLGIDPDLLKASPNYYSTDQCEARAMNTALWPATLGYFMDQMMEPVFEEQTIRSTRAYFNRYVVGRGTIPAVRVGKQPYGILPATPYSRMAWLSRKILANDRVDTGIPDQFAFLPALYALVKKADVQWSELTAQVSYVGKPGADPHQVLLDVVGLHPSSVEFYQRYAETFEQLYNRFKLSGNGAGFIAAIIAMGYMLSGQQLLESLGHEAGDAAEMPEILNKLFLQAANLLKGPAVDDVPLSESEAVRAYRADGANYLDWLVTAARESHDTLRKQAGFIDDKPPTALLYLMLRHALDIGYVTTGIQLHVDADLLTQSQALAARREPKFLHIQDAQEDTGSPWQYLYKAEPAITSDPQLSIARYIPQILVSRNPYLNTQIQALEHLQQVPTARLERAFAEHIDLCTNRLDAWWLGLLNVQLEIMRTSLGASDGGDSNGGDPSGGDDTGNGDAEGGTPAAGRGCYLGAYAWVEDLRPDNKVFTPVELPPELGEIFNKPGQAPLGEDSQNFGYIHAPSLDHAVTAAVLRNGYEANATPANPGSLAINLTSERVRLAMGVVEGMRNGQSLSALLGYQLERGLHDADGLFLDSIIFELRRQFPLMANRFANTRAATGTRIQSIEARNVVDGLALIEHVQAQPPSEQGYPFGLGTDLPTVTDQAALDAINAQVARIADINDAVADLAMAEGVYQVVRGNYDRAAGTLDAYGKGSFPPTPEVVQTPRSGVTLTHRVGIHLSTAHSPDDAGNTTPRAKGEPSINAWLASKLPAMAQIYCLVDYFDHAADTTQTVEVTAQALGLLPIDLLYLLNRDGVQDSKALDDHINQHIVTSLSPRPDADIRIRYADRQSGKFSFFEVSPLLADLHALLLRSRPLKATDTRLPNEAQTSEEDTAAIRPVKLVRVRDLLDAQRVLLGQYVTDAGVLLDDPDDDIVVNNAIGNVDALIQDYAAIGDDLSRFGLPGAGLGFALDWRRRAFGDLATVLEALIDRWDSKLAEFDQKIVDFSGLDPGLSDPDRIAYLLEAALLISTAVILPPVSGDPLDLLATLNATTRSDFDSALTDLKSILPAATTVGGLYTAMQTRVATVALHDAEGLDLDANRTAIAAFARTLRSKATSLLADITGRLDAADALIVGEPQDSPADRVESLTEAMRKLTSADFVVLPEFTLGPEHAAEWQTAFDDRLQLLAFLRNDAGVDFPVDDWLYGVARVRQKLHHVESATMFAEALAGVSLALEPLQFPYRPDDAWLALRYPQKKPGTEEAFVIDEDKLLYTAHYATPFDSTQALHCGLLVDEWTEVIPTTEETTGLAFHYDRPNTEPPQTLLLALPADFTGSWAWQDLVDTLHETLDLARKRAVEPQHIDETEYARFLPAVISSVTRRPLLHMLNYAFNNAVQFSASGDGSS